MKKLIVALVLLSGIASTPSIAKTYISGSTGLGISGTWEEVNFDDSKYDNAVAWNGAVGNNFGSYRLEAALGYESHNLNGSNSDKTSFLTIMANGYYDFDSGSKIIPYLMAGAGVANVDVFWTTENSTSFVWQVGAGAGFKIDDNVTMDLGYRYIKPEGLQCPYDNNDVSWNSQHIMAGVRYQF
jgi:opacity protein-like surface antigen